ncbi:hypothetical protein [Kitasatospora sp. NBC_00315]|uniref:hypothetical protein n=1 Tax=Kitasatospora sp. NBC_00315 TaxID=2975963 RepID=UPI00324E0050
MSSGDNTGERNPFAPPPADAPDQPWQPRTPQPPAGEDPAAGQPEDSDGEEPRTGPPAHPWSPGYQGPWHPQPAPQQPRFDPGDPAQRRARNSLVAGMAALVCALGISMYVALFVGGLAVYWAVSALRSTPRPATADTPATPGATRAPAAPGGRTDNPQSPAALGGLFTGGVAVVVVACSIALSLYYQDYNVCVRDALTTTAGQNCDKLAPAWYVNLVNPSQ